MNKTYKRKQGDPITAESLDEIRRLAEMSDEFINTDDIPERVSGQAKRIEFPFKAEQRPGAHRKAS